MPDQKISELAAITTIDNAADVLPIVDTSATTTKKVTPTQLKSSLALNNVDNTSDANKPVSSAQQTALDAKQATLVSGTNIKTVNNTSLLGSGNITIAGGGGTWGSITGTLSNQTDLQTALDGKVDENTAITGATKTKITYDAKGLVTAGADATTADIADSSNKRYVTDANLTLIQNTSGTNTGDNAVNSLYSGLATSKQDTLVSGTNIKTVNSTSLLGSGDVAVQATLVSGTNIKTVNSTSLLGSGNISVAPATGIDATAIADGTVTSTEFQYINSLTSNAQTQIDGKQATLVSGTNIKTINSTSLLGSGDIVIGGGSPSGVSGAIQFSDGSAFSSDATNFFWDDTNNRLGVGTNTPSATTHIKGSGTTSGTTSFLVQNSSGADRIKTTDNGKTTFTPASAYSMAIETANYGIIRAGGGYENADGVYGADGGLFLRATSNMYITANNGNAASFGLFGTGLGFNIGTGLSVDASAVLNLNSTTRGFLPPRMTTSQKTSISTPSAGLVVYDSTTNKLCCYNGSTWNDLF
jgi:hypothetical protein